MLSWKGYRRTSLSLWKGLELVISYGLFRQNFGYYSTWLPKDHSAVALLREKGFIIPLGRHIKSIGDNSKLFSDSLSYAFLFTVPALVRDILADMPPELAARWHNTKPNNSFAQF